MHYPKLSCRIFLADAFGSEKTEMQLPRLLYIGDVPVESSYHGSALIYRLLQGFPMDRLMIVEGSIYPSLPDRRLPGITYKTLQIGYNRLLNSRLHHWYSLWLSLRATVRAEAALPLIGGFKPDAVLTVAHGYSWVTAAEFARRHRLPLHLIVHDDWPRVRSLPQAFADRVDRQFRHVYRTSASRLCVSPFMAEEYLRRYGVSGQVLYPSRAQDAQIFSDPPDRLRENRGELVVAFAGTINTPDYCRLMRTLADCLEAQNGRLMIFGPTTADQAAAAGLARPNIQLCGLLTSGQLLERLRAEVDVLFVPMSFAAADRANMEISFPSKLTDYTAVGLPLLIYGPEYCSAVRWASDNPGVAEVVDAEDIAGLATAVERLAKKPEHRARLAMQALTIGDRYFSHSAAQESFYAALNRLALAESVGVRRPNETSMAS